MNTEHWLAGYNKILELARFAATVCKGRGDRVYRAKDQTWWKRQDNTWVSADPPAGWVNASSPTKG
jgi:hypothetical protein